MDEYPLYEAKARLSALVRQVREGKSVVITVHGEPVAELRPYQAAPRPQTLAERVAELEAKGMITPPKVTPEEIRAQIASFVGHNVPGALQRFLDERD
jgi:prevent-host-death family protein